MRKAYSPSMRLVRPRLTLACFLPCRRPLPSRSFPHNSSQVCYSPALHDQAKPTPKIMPRANPMRCPPTRLCTGYYPSPYLHASRLSSQKTHKHEPLQPGHPRRSSLTAAALHVTATLHQAAMHLQGSCCWL